MEVKLISKKPDNTDIVAGLFGALEISKHPLLKTLGEEDLAYLTAVAKKTEFDKGKTEILRLPSNPTRSVMLLGLGKKTEWNARKLMLTARKLLAVAKEARLDSIVLNLKDFSVKGQDATELMRLLVQNAIAANYAYTPYKEKPKEGWPEMKSVSIYFERPPAKLQKALREGYIIGTAVNDCRNLCNTPGSDMTPQMLAKAAQDATKEVAGLKVKVLGLTEIRKLGMGGVLGVSQGSSEEPRFIILEYGPIKKEPIVFVGKGITYDSGGLNIKGEKGLLDMRMDMSGGAAVIQAMVAIARLKLPIRIVGLIPAAENMPSGTSYRPGDLLKTYKGKTIEVINTDAEGRVILADALGYAQDYKPKLVVDVATLTGGAMIALGLRANALFANQEKLLNLGKKVGEQCGDFAWPLPSWDEYDEEVKGTFGDVANSGKYYPYGSPIDGAVFLKQFVGDYPWMHLDIAPTMTSIEGQYLAKGAAGSGVRFLVELARQYK